MTSADRRRVRKALQGKDFPAQRTELIAYAEERSADEATMQAFYALPEGEYRDTGEVEQAVPQSPAEEDPRP